MPQDGIPENNTSKEYEMGLLTELSEFLRTDADLVPFYDRYRFECENIVNVIEKSKNKTLDKTLLEQLKTFNAKFPTLKNSAIKLGQIDKTFHEILFEMTGDPRLREIFRKIIMNDGDPTRIWQSIIRNETHYQELCRYHSDIVKSIEREDEKEALVAIQRHFVRVLPHYIQQQFSSKIIKRNDNQPDKG